MSPSFLKKHENSVSLILTSPPFPLNRKKAYGNKQEQAYLEWFSSLGPVFRRLLKNDGSLVIEMGNSWQKGAPTMSTLALRTLLGIMEQGGFHLCQQFVWVNLAKLPSPAQWVTIERIRVKDSFTHIWWLSKTPRPKANNRNVLQPYGKQMEKLLTSRLYNAGKRPSEHVISPESFLKRNGGSIPSNVLVSSNTQSNSAYQRFCREHRIVPHPARMPKDIPEFFIELLTDPKDLVLDPFGGSNTTGSVAEELKRRWLTIEPKRNYVLGSVGHFPKLELAEVKRQIRNGAAR